MTTVLTWPASHRRGTVYLFAADFAAPSPQPQRLARQFHHRKGHARRAIQHPLQGYKHGIRAAMIAATVIVAGKTGAHAIAAEQLCQLRTVEQTVALARCQRIMPEHHYLLAAGAGLNKLRFQPCQLRRTDRAIPRLRLRLLARL